MFPKLTALGRFINVFLLAFVFDNLTSVQNIVTITRKIFIYHFIGKKLIMNENIVLTYFILGTHDIWMTIVIQQN